MRTLFCIILACLMSSCATTDIVKQNDELVSQSVYATNDAMNVGRFDRAKVYSDQTVRLVPPPKNRIIIKPFIIETDNKEIIKPKHE